MKSKVEIDPKLPEEWAEFHVHELTPKLQQVIQLLEHDKFGAMSIRSLSR